MNKQAFQGDGQINICSSKWRQDLQMMAIVAIHEHGDQGVDGGSKKKDIKIVVEVKSQE